MDAKRSHRAPAEEASRRWQPMRLEYVGDAGDVLQTGGGKESPSPFDPGETRKPPGQAAKTSG